MSGKYDQIHENLLQSKEFSKDDLHIFVVLSGVSNSFYITSLYGKIEEVFADFNMVRNFNFDSEIHIYSCRMGWPSALL